MFLWDKLEKIHYMPSFSYNNIYWSFSPYSDFKHVLLSTIESTQIK